MLHFGVSLRVMSLGFFLGLDLRAYGVSVVTFGDEAPSEGSRVSVL